METMVRIFRPGEESELWTLLADAHGDHYDAPRPDGFRPLNALTQQAASSARTMAHR